MNGDLDRILPEKHLPYFEVLDAIRTADACGMCALEEKGLRGYFEGLLSERVLDGGTRQALGRSRGYCHWHAHYLAERPDTFGIALLYGQQVGLLLDFLRKPPKPGRWVAEWTTHEACPACSFQREGRNRHAQVLATWWGEPEMSHAVKWAAPLCALHALSVLDRIDDPARAAGFRSVQEGKWAALASELDEFCAKQDHERITEVFGEERDSWRRAVDVMVSGKWVVHGGGAP